LEHTDKRIKLLSREAKERLYQGIAITRLPRFLNRTLFQKAHTVITYHGVRNTDLAIPDECFIARDRFISQMLYIKQHFTVVPLSQALAMGVSQRRAGPPILSITFDDGFQNVYDNAFPVLKDLGLPATVFLVTSLTDTDGTIWYCALNHAFAETKQRSIAWRDRRFDLTNPENRVRACRTLQVMLKEMPHDALVLEAEGTIASLGFDPGGGLPENSPFRILNSRDIQEMRKSGLIDFGAHTHTHSILSLLTEEAQEREIRSSIDRVCEVTGRPCTLFSYPNGEAGDFGENTRDLLIRNNIECSVTMMRGPNYPDTDRFCYRRYGIESAMSDHRFMMNVHHMVWVKRSISRTNRQCLRQGSEQIH